jgi:hypothetical protein
MYDKVAAYKRSLHAHKEKLKTAKHSKEEHENRKVPCEKCAVGLELGYGREFKCNYYWTLLERIRKLEGEIVSLRTNIQRAEREASRANS